MSWDSYIDNVVARAQGHADTACIVGLDGSKWTTDAAPNALKISPTEAVAICGPMKGRDYTQFQVNGVKIDGVKYQFLRNDGSVVLAKKKDQGAITIQASKTALVIAHTKEGSQQGITNTAVSGIAEYLESLNM